MVAMAARHFWIGVVAQDHAERAVAGSFAQVNHGKAGPLERLHAGDGFAIYSPRSSHPGGAALQAFTAIGRVRSGIVYQVEVDARFRPFRIDVDYLSANAAPIRPLIESLTFLHSKTHWGAAFRFGFVRIPAGDFGRIATAMGRDFAADFPDAASDFSVTADTADGNAVTS
jgi:hypothetical protein